jgi:hypothetical protein
LFFERIAGAAELDKGMGVVKACPPVAWSAYKLLLGYKMPAMTALKFFIVDPVIARFTKTGKLLLHRTSLMIVGIESCY